ncbi:replication initiator protein [Capybara microvirus Cap3_SP_320]|nr:replication initiator protein [Capybara microvirus Cap3_SP_320]
MWLERSKYERQKFDGVGAFVTFTYDDIHVRDLIDFRFENPSPSLRRSDFHKYIDSIRHSCPVRFSYIGCGEYGDLFRRPHYHCIFFGLDFASFGAYLKRHWRFGSVKVLPVRDGSVRYVLKYLMSSVNGPLRSELYFDVGLEPPFVTRSKGFGSGLYFDNFESISRDGFIRKGSRIIPVPAYYRNKYISLSMSDIVRRDESFSAFCRSRMSETSVNYDSYNEFVYDQSQVKEANLQSSSRLRLLPHNSDFSIDSSVGRAFNFDTRKLYNDLKGSNSALDVLDPIPF